MYCATLTIQTSFVQSLNIIQTCLRSAKINTLVHMHKGRHFGVSFTSVGGVKAEISMSQNTEKIRKSPLRGHRYLDLYTPYGHETCIKVSTVELLITDPPRSDHPLHNGQPLWNGLNLP